MADRVVRAAVVGLGRIGWRFHVPALVAHEEFDLVAVVDTDGDRLDQAAAELGCSTFRDIATMIRTTSPEVVVIAAPTHLHREIALEALDSGAHVLLEKPMARDSAEASEIIERAEARDLIVTTYQPHRLSAYFQQTRHLISSGTIGTIYRVKRGMFSYARRNDWQSLRKYGGGMLNNYGAHAIDQVLNLVGYDVERVFGNLAISASLGDADDVADVMVETGSGKLGVVEINQASVIQPYELLVWGTAGALVCQHDTITLRTLRSESMEAREVDERLAGANRQYPSDPDPYDEVSIPIDPNYEINVYSDLARAIRTGSPTTVTASEVLEVMRVIDRVRSSGDIHDWRSSKT